MSNLDTRVSVHIVPFRLGYAVPEALSKPNLEFYSWLAQIILQNACIISNSSSQSSIPLDNKSIENAPYRIYGLFQERLSKVKRKTDLIIIDIANPLGDLVPGRVLPHVAGSIVAAIENPISVLGEPRYCILVPELPPEQDYYYVLLAKHVESGRVILISDDGHCLSQQELGQRFESENYQQRLTKARAWPLRLLALKMIRRRGHFKLEKSGRHYRCRRFYFDGSLCDFEIAALLEESVKNLLASNKMLALVYEDSTSPWLINPLYAVANTHGLQCNSVKEMVETRPKGMIDGVERPIMLVTGVVDSGSTLERSLARLSEHGVAAKPEILTILTTHPSDPEHRIRSMTLNETKFDVRYLLAIERNTDPPQQCEMCKLAIPSAASDQAEPYDMLTSYEMWDMIREVGVVSEGDVPSYRAGLGNIPVYAKIVELNGPWIATKIRRCLEASIEGLPHKAVIVCPNEREATSFTDTVQHVLDCSIIKVPRDIINACAAGSVTAEQQLLGAARRKPEWFQQLNGKAVTDVIVMDVFNVSGRTFLGLTNLLAYYGKVVLCYFLFNDLNPTVATGLPAPTYSLYEYSML